jgi:hypothetical protein
MRGALSLDGAIIILDGAMRFSLICARRAAWPNGGQKEWARCEFNHTAPTPSVVGVRNPAASGNRVPFPNTIMLWCPARGLPDCCVPTREPVAG